MGNRPVRLNPGEDLRRSLEALAKDLGGGFILCGIGSLAGARLRLAGDEVETRLEGPFEILTLSGSVSEGGAHLHVTVSGANGQVIGGHLCYGNIVRTTVEALLATTEGWSLDRQLDAATGYKELVIGRKGDGVE
jgi:predicted DNA-binding protein with PD1-like motif